MEYRFSGQKRLSKGIYQYNMTGGGSPEIKIVYRARHCHKGKQWASKLMNTEREAKLEYDKHLIFCGLPPVYILKKK